MNSTNSSFARTNHESLEYMGRHF